MALALRTRWTIAVATFGVCWLLLSWFVPKNVPQPVRADPLREARHAAAVVCRAGDRVIFEGRSVGMARNATALANFGKVNLPKTIGVEFIDAATGKYTRILGTCTVTRIPSPATR